ncbi:bifunctional DNA primase/polymerase [Streptomyces olivaceus]|uniref:phage/plasmid primase, P4 family n=1 Tax=Streptomyces olivaceus TaxID=47716 RepID=UPI001CCE03FA|nr:phage/plasmid primase, P4 family [Streptomyces olivaceus]MBZ6250524.1 bifunctional DNA primase/polymerase [Streptomyces olivaceus]
MSDTTPDTLEAALTLHAAGCSVVAVRTDGSKHPRGQWKTFQSQAASEQQLRTWFTDGHPGIGIICGTVSGNLEMLELEGRAVTEGVLTQLAEIFLGSGLGELWQRLATGWLERSPSGGLHFHYRITGAPVPGNTKLASRLAREDEYTDDELALKERHPNKKILRGLIETRGEGGFVVTAPSHGPVHASGRPYELLAGGPATVPTLTADEHQAVHTICRMIDAIPSDDVAKVEPAPNPAGQEPLDEAAAFLFSGSHDTETGGISPLDDFETKTSWADILQPHGWKLMFVSGQTHYWQRPGKDGREPSATTGRATDRDRLYVFTTSTEFTPETPYTKAGAYAVLNHSGNHSAAASALRRQGYGQTAPEPVRHLSTVPHPAAPTDGTAALNVVPHPTAQQDDGPTTYTRTDDGNALRLVDTHEHEIRYVPQRGKWLHWNGHRWEWDEAGHVREMARAIARNLPNGEGEAKHRARSLSHAGISAMLGMAQTDPRTVALMDTLDAHPLHLNTPGGIVNLANGTITAPDPAAMHTRTTSVAPDPEMPTPKWAQFLIDTFGEDSDIATFVQRLAGYSASGDTRFHILPFLNGPGGNGKSVFLDVLRILLGDYAASAPNTFLMAGQQQHETEVARLQGLRLVVVSEVNQDARFDEAKMKLLTGGDALTARFMRQDHFTFEPTHHLWLMGNHLPAVKAGGDSFWRRLRLIPFTRSVPPERKIEGLARILADEEGPGILAWMVAGAVSVFAEGLREPAAVMAFTETYAEEEDSLARFMSDCCHIGGGTHVAINTAKLRAAYDDWCRAEGETPLKPQVFGRELRTRFGIEQTRSNGRRFYIGVALLIQPDEGDDQ